MNPEVKTLLRQNLNLADWPRIVNELVNELELNGSKTSKRILFLMNGEMAAGKTTFVRHFCEHFGFKWVQSPTYALHQSYENKNLVMDHFDLYRIQDIDTELDTISFWETLNARLTKNHIVFVEWSSRINDSDWPTGFTHVNCQLREASDSDMRDLCVRISRS